MIGHYQRLQIEIVVTELLKDEVISGLRLTPDLAVIMAKAAVEALMRNRNRESDDD